MNIIICGIGGKVGRTLMSILEKRKDIKIVAGVDKYADKSQFDIPVYDNFSVCDVKADVVIDFSRPDAIDDILNYAIKNRANLVIATTGHSEVQQAMIDKASLSVAIFQSSNMSLGVNLLIGLAKQAAAFLGNTYDIEIVEYHHNLKVDSPSGTALSIAQGINNVFSNKKNFIYGRHSGNDKRTSDDIGIHAVRGGTIVGKHEVMYIGKEEIVTLKHEAESRGVFAYGGLRAAEFIYDKKSGKYDMNDIIGKDYSVTVVSCVPDVALININNIKFKSFGELLTRIGDKMINLDMISQTITDNGNVNISFSFEIEDSAEVEGIIKAMSIEYAIISEAGKLIIEGAGMEHQYGIAAEVTNLLVENNTAIYAITTSETKISMCIDSKSLNKSEAIIKSHFKVKM